MALFARDFPRAGGDPEVTALANTIRPTIGDPFYVAVASGVVTIQKPTAWAAGDIVTVQAAVTAAPAATVQTDAQRDIDGMGIFQKAILLALLDQLNVVRAALPSPLGAITPAQALAAVRAKAGTL